MMFSIRFQQKGSRDLLAKINRLPKALDRAMWKMAQLGAKNIKQQAKARGHVQTGNLIRRVMARHISSRQSMVFIPKYGFDLGTMKPHFVSLGGTYNSSVRPGQRKKLAAWVIAKFRRKHIVKSGMSRVSYTKTGKPRGWLYVQPSTYLYDALMLTRAKTRMILRDEIRRAMKG